MQEQRTYIAIDLKSFFASVECVERGLDPLTTNLVVADETRTEKTICLAVTPSLKAYGIGGRARLFEAIQRVRQVNAERRRAIGGRPFIGKSTNDSLVQADPFVELDFIRAMPRMAYYIEYSTRIYKIYLKYVAPEDIHVYSIDEVFMDVTKYLPLYKMNAHDFAMKLIRDVLGNTGITATAGIGSNMYLCKVAMDIVAKHIPPDRDGVRIAALDEMSYRRMLWSHRPLTDFWRVGKGTAKRLSQYGMETMGDIARCSVRNEEVLYKLLGVNAELLIDHAWGWEPCTMEAVKAYRPSSNSFSSSQVLKEPYTFAMARNVLLEMADAVSLNLVSRHLLTRQLTLTVNYDRECLLRRDLAALYDGPVVQDHYGRQVPKYVHVTVNTGELTSSGRLISDALAAAYDKNVHHGLLIRRLTVSTNNVIPEEEARSVAQQPRQLDLFEDYVEGELKQKKKEEARSRERKMQEAVLKIKEKFGKNAILRGTSYDEGATARERNAQIGGHKA